jgi:hypothetical protein
MTGHRPTPNESKPLQKQAKALAKRPDHGTYAVGYGRPPDDTRFKPGQSGNPKGRPKGKGKKTSPATPDRERLGAIILEEAYRAIKVNDGDRHVTVPMAQAIMRSVAVAAAKGNSRSQKLFADLLSSTESSSRKERDDWLQTVVTYKQDWEYELEHRQRHGLTLPDPIPHPDDVQINFRTGEVAIRGPFTKEERDDLDLWLTRKHENEAELVFIKADRDDPKNAEYLHIIEDEITYTTRILDIINRALALRASPACIERRLKQLDLKEPEYLIKLKRLKQEAIAS